MDILHAPRPPPNAARSSAAPRSAAAAASSSSSSCRTAAAAGDELEDAWRSGVADVVSVEADERQGGIVAHATRDLLRLSDERRGRRAAEDAELAAREALDAASSAALVACDVAFGAGLDALACAEAEAVRRSYRAAAEAEARAAAVSAARAERRALLGCEAAARAAAALAAAELRARVLEEGAERAERAALLAGERGAWLRARGVELAAAGRGEDGEVDEEARALETCLMQERRRQREEERAAAERQRSEEEAYVAAQGRHISGMLALERGELAGYEAYMRLCLVDDEAHAFLTDVLNPKQAQLFAAGEGYVRGRIEGLRGMYVAYVLDRLCCEERADVVRAHAAALGRLASEERSGWLAARRVYTERSDRETRALHRRLEQEGRTRAEKEQRRADARASVAVEEAAARAAAAAEESRGRGVLREAAEGSVRAAVVAVITRQVEAEVEAATLHWTPETWEALHTQQLGARGVLEAEREAGVRAMESAETQAYIAARAAEVAANPDTLSFLRLYREAAAPPDAATAAAAAAEEEEERVRAAAAAACYAAAADERAGEQRERLRVLKEKWEDERHARDLESLRREQEAAEQCAARREEAARRQRERAQEEDAVFVELQEAHGRTLVSRAWAEGVRAAAEEAAAAAAAGLDLVAPSGAGDGAEGGLLSSASAPLPPPPSRLPGGDEHQQQVALLVEAELRKREIFERAERRHTGVLESAFRDGQLEVLFPHTGGGGVDDAVVAPPHRPPVVGQEEDAVPMATATALEGLLQAPGGALPSATPPCSPALPVPHGEGRGFGNTDSDDGRGGGSGEAVAEALAPEDATAVPMATATAAAATLEGLLQAPCGALPSATPPCSPALPVPHGEGRGFGNTDSDDDDGRGGGGSSQAVNAGTVARGLADMGSRLTTVRESGEDVTPCNSPLFAKDTDALGKAAMACPDNVDGAPTTVEQAMQKVRDLTVLSGEG